MTGAYGITITGDVATITLSVPALWLLAITVLSGVFMTYTTTRDWLAGVLTRVWQEDRHADKLLKDIVKGGTVTTDLIQPCDASSHKGLKVWE